MSEQLSGQDAPVSSSAVIIAQLNVPPGTEDEFVRWHTEEHVPQASKVPGLGTDHRLFRSLELEGKYWHYQPNPQFTAVYEVSSDTDFRSLVDSPEFQGWAQEFASRGTATEDYELLTACRRIY